MRAIIVGAGHWHAPWHVAALRARSVEIVGVWDHDPQAATIRAAAWNSRAYDSAEALIREGADIAVLSPRAADAPYLLRLLIAAHIPVIAEKPLGLKADAVEDLAGLASSSNLFVAVTLVNRLSPVWDAMDRSEPIVASFRIINGTPQRYVDDGVDWVLDPGLGGGGALRNLGIHGADAVCAMAGDDVLTVASAVLWRDPAWNVEVFAAATVQSSRGWSARIEAGYVNPDRDGSDFEWRLATRDRYVVDRDTEVQVSNHAGTTKSVAPRSAERYDSFIGRALADLSAGHPPMVGLPEAARAARLVDDIYAVATSLTTVVHHEGAQ